MNPVEVIRRHLYGEQYDVLAEAGVFDDPVVSCPPEEEVVRKEFQRESEIEYQLKMFASGGLPNLRRAHSGYVNYDVDRLGALEILGQAEQLWSELPAKVRENFKDFGELQAAALDGRLAELMKPVEEKKSEEPPKT